MTDTRPVTPAPPHAAFSDYRHAVQRRVMWVLMASVIPSASAMTAAFAATAVLAEDITGSETLAGMAAGSLSFGTVGASVPLARLMARKGRRAGLVTGWMIGTVGATCVFAAAVAELYPLLVVGIIAVGGGQAANLATRFAAADLVDADHRGRAIGMMVWATTFGAVAGPTIALGPAGDVAEALGLPELSVPFLLGLLAFAGGAVITWTELRPDPLEVLGTLTGPSRRTTLRRQARSDQDHGPPAAPGVGALHGETGGNAPSDGVVAATAPGAVPSPVARTRPTPLFTVIGRIARNPEASLAVLGMLVGQAVMVGVMTMTPLHMTNGDHELRVIGLVISLHIVGMYAFSPVVGWFVDRVGPYVMVGSGGVVLFVGAEMASHTSPEDSLGVFVGLLLVGLGWSFGLISGSSLLTGAFPANQRVEVQGAADMIMTLGGALAGFSAGAAMEIVGFHTFSHWAAVAALVLVAAASGAWLMQRRATPAGV